MFYLPNAAIVERKVIVILKLTSPPRSKVQKFEPVPPGLHPKTSSPNPCKGSSIKRRAIPNEN